MVYLEKVEQAVFAVIEGLAKALEFFGADGAAASVRDFAEATKEASKASKDYADKQADLVKRGRELKGLREEGQSRSREIKTRTR